MTRPGRRTLLGACLGAGAMAAIPAIARAADAAVMAPVNALDDALIATMKSAPGRSFVERFAALAPTLRRVFDLGEILLVSVGPAWSGIPTQMQGLLLNEFDRYTVASYVANFNGYTGQRFEVSPEVRQVGANQIVQTTLIDPAGSTTRIDYVMRNRGGSWRIVDVLLDGTISRVAVQRSDFRQVVTSGGGQGLLRMLQRKVAELSGGAMS
jgi:phospholipid transport system substrate-binding protein